MSHTQFFSLPLFSLHKTETQQWFSCCQLRQRERKVAKKHRSHGGSPHGCQVGHLRKNWHFFGICLLLKAKCHIMPFRPLFIKYWAKFSMTFTRPDSEDLAALVLLFLFWFFAAGMCPEFAISRKSGTFCPFPFFAPRYLQIARSAKNWKKWRFLNFWNFYVVIFKYLTKYSKDEKILKNAIKFLIFFGWRFFLRFLG